MPLMIDIMNRYGHGAPYKKYKGTFGIEIETESAVRYEVPTFAFWVQHQDNSLRDFGVEYVLKQPLQIEKEIPEALEEFKEKTKHVKFKEQSNTTSVHVHMNMLNLNTLQFANFLTVYSLVENLLVRFCGESRTSNLFALPICDAEETYVNILELLRGIGNFKYHTLNLPVESTKYAAINLSALSRFGSLEIRTMGGVTDTKVILDWVSILNALLEYAKGVKDPLTFVEAYRVRGLGIIEEIFGKYSKLLLIPGSEHYLDKNLWYTTSIADVSKDWETFGEPPKPKASPDMDITSIKLFGKKFEALTSEQQIKVHEYVLNPGKKKGVKAPNNFFREAVEADREAPPVPRGVLEGVFVANDQPRVDLEGVFQQPQWAINPARGNVAPIDENNGLPREQRRHWPWSRDEIWEVGADNLFTRETRVLLRVEYLNGLAGFRPLIADETEELEGLQQELLWIDERMGELAAENDRRANERNENEEVPE